MESSYSMKELINLSNKENFIKILRALFNRIPIFIVGNESIQIDRIVHGIVQLLPHRHDLLYWNDFIENSEAEQLFAGEEADYNVKRLVISSLSNATPHALRKIKNYRGWVLGYHAKSKSFREILSDLKESVDQSVFLLIHDEGIEMLQHGFEWNGKNFEFEKNLIQNSIIKTEMAIEKMNRVLRKKIKSKKLPSNQMLDAIMNFDTEEAKIRQNIYNQIVDEFVQAGLRALAILSRIELLQELGFNVQISEKTLLKTIDYKDVDYERLLEFLKHEYGIDFSKCIGTGIKIQIGDVIESKWG
ncbi:MAG: hypothetical protein EU551_03460 [Promethearchaeota archaeon]|nr:MAG: hypothetical protein EU551_03460 [Candidatus Lokiarchaeota archaeon]